MSYRKYKTQFLCKLRCEITCFYCIQTTKGAQGRIAQMVTCLAADSGVASSILARSHTFVEIDHEIISRVILLPSTDSRRVVVSYKRKYVQEVLVNCLVKLAQEKSG